ncbi:uncharacterized protein LOC100893717 isoform X2 [Strongylocentrotus purpuratus]|uniref:3'-5' exonuclease domain-containing protein n=1 Tax=Strongylocentrotus purpuratus TaxID=7668 RepID=A0A7M7LWA9_STRPU|nr:uncharacterized protein LOC100893717 isoform X2 [Strongylocentrotus purpuratus]|eukprot:XP_011676400.1 PREDICTED: uncharacterized protein LOC100893717 isoform X2 [Strongylocentrotus purpuratus]
MASTPENAKSTPETTKPPPETPNSPPATSKPPPETQNSPPVTPKSPTATPKSPTATPKSPTATPKSPPATPKSPRSRMEATKTDTHGRLYRIKKTCARVRLLDLDNEEARVDIAILRRILGIGVNDLRDVLRRSAHVHVDLMPMKDAPRIFQRSSAPWNVVNIRLANGEPVDKAATIFANPAAYFMGKRNMQIPFKRSRPCIRPEMTGMAVEAIWSIFAEMDVDHIEVKVMLEKLKGRFSKSELPVIHGESNSLPQRFRRWFMTIPLYFTLRWGKEEGATMISLHPGFVEADIQKEIRRRALVLFKRRSRRRNRSRSRSVGSEHSDGDISVVEEEVPIPVSSGRVPVINESAKCSVVVDTLFKDAAKAGMLVISFDCKGPVLDDKMEVALVQLSTIDGEVWIFDVTEKEGKTSLMKEGRLKELLEAECVMKVMHDCLNTATNLFRQFEVKMCNVFDTTLAYETLLNQCNIFPVEHEVTRHRIELSSLCEMVGETYKGEDDKMSEVLKNNPHMWDDRPLSEDLVKYAAGTVRALVPRVFNKLDRLIHPAWQQYFDWMCEETLHQAQTTK